MLEFSVVILKVDYHFAVANRITVVEILSGNLIKVLTFWFVAIWRKVARQPGLLLA